MAKAISFAGLLPSDRIVVGLKGKSYEDAVGRLLDRLAAAELISDRAVLDALVAADSAGEVPTLGGSALLVHYRTDAVRELALAIGTSTAPFAFTPADAPEARFMALIVAPRSAAKYYLKTVAALSRLLRESDVATSLVEAKSAKEVLAIIREHDVVIQPARACKRYSTGFGDWSSPSSIWCSALSRTNPSRVWTSQAPKKLPTVVRLCPPFIHLFSMRNLKSATAGVPLIASMTPKSVSTLTPLSTVWVAMLVFSLKYSWSDFLSINVPAAVR